MHAREQEKHLPVIKITINILLYTNLKHFLIMIEGQEVIERINFLLTVNQQRQF
jgi:hypothetical protein